MTGKKAMPFPTLAYLFTFRRPAAHAILIQTRMNTGSAGEMVARGTPTSGKSMIWASGFSGGKRRDFSYAVAFDA